MKQISQESVHTEIPYKECNHFFIGEKDADCAVVVAKKIDHTGPY